MPSEEIPKYVHDGIDRQRTAALEAIVKYCHARIEWLANGKSPTKTNYTPTMSRSWR